MGELEELPSQVACCLVPRCPAQAEKEAEKERAKAEKEAEREKAKVGSAAVQAVPLQARCVGWFDWPVCLGLQAEREAEKERKHKEAEVRGRLEP